MLIAPTGFGKTRAAIEPFADSLARLREAAGRPSTSAGNNIPEPVRRLGTRLLFVLPLRALARGVTDEFQNICERYGTSLGHLGGASRMIVHHGAQPESEAFCENAVATTIDQYLTALAGAPLSFADSTGHAAAGATLASYTVFDEAHLLEPRRALSLLVAILILRRRWQLPTLVMTATLPSAVRDHLRKHGGLELVEPSADEVREGRDAWRRVSLAWEGKLDDTQSLALAQKLQREHGRVLWFVNRVSHAQAVYRSLRDAGVEARLLHARFRAEDREAHERDLHSLLGRSDKREQDWEGVVVTTQVSEAGLNISAAAVLSEACPADALIQRAGRCTRFPSFAGGTASGALHVYVPNGDNPWAPYEQDVWEASQAVVQASSGAVLDWTTERDLVERSLGELYAWFVRGESGPRKNLRPRDFPGMTPADALGAVERAYQARDPRPVERVLRELAQAHVSICEDPVAFKDQLWHRWGRHHSERGSPESIAVPIGEVRRAVGQATGGVFEIVREGTGKAPTLRWVGSPGEVRVGRHYVVTAADAGYNPEEGLTWQPGRGTGVTGWQEPRERGTDRTGESRPQSFAEHSLGVLDRVEAILPLYDPFLAGWLEGVFGEVAGDVPDRLREALREGALFHDVGKLKASWQDAIRRASEGIAANLPSDPFVARTRVRSGRLGVAHAPDVFPFLMALWGMRPEDATEPALVAIAGAVARHHSVPRADTFPDSGDDILVSGAEKELARLANERLASGAGTRATGAAAHVFASAGATGRRIQANDMPSPSDDLYPLYTWVNRLIKMADREDAGGEVKELPWLR